MAGGRLRTLLRIWTVVFLLGAIDFFVFPYLTVRIVNAGGRALITGDLVQAKSDYVEELKIEQRIVDRVAQYALLDGLGCSGP